MYKTARLLVLIVASSAALTSMPQMAGAGEPPPVSGWMEQFSFIEPPRPAPQTGFLAGTGTPVTMSEFRGRVLLVNFWATWCAPCIRELPSLDTLQARLGDEGLLVLAVSQDRGGAAVAGPFLKKLGVTRLGLFLDPRMELGRALGVRALPWSVLIDRDGRVVGMLPGYAEWDSAEGIRLIRHYLAPDGSQGVEKERVRETPTSRESAG